MNEPFLRSLKEDEAKEIYSEDLPEGEFGRELAQEYLDKVKETMEEFFANASKENKDKNEFVLDR